MHRKVFSLAGRSLKLDTAAQVDEHIAPLLASNDFTEVHLGGNTFGVGACERLAPALAAQTRLEVANLADIFTGRLLAEIPQALGLLLDALLAVDSLHTVDLSDNAFGLNTQAPLVKFLSRHRPLRHLVLNNNGLGPAAGAMVADALAQLAAGAGAATAAATNGDGDGDDAAAAAAKTGALETIVCGRNRLENGSMQAWARALQLHAGSLRTVKLTQNGIRQEGIALLLHEGLRHARGLQVVDLQDNTFTAAGSGALAAVVPGWPSLRELGVGDCLLSARGAIRLAQALAAGNNQAVETLRLQYNEITAAAVQQLLHAAHAALPLLRRIELNGNRFFEDDPPVTELRELLHARRARLGSPDDPVDMWGLDELDELEETDDDDDDEDEQEAEEQDEEERLADRELADTIRAEDETVAQQTDVDVDRLADLLGKEL